MKTSTKIAIILGLISSPFIFLFGMISIILFVFVDIPREARVLTEQQVKYAFEEVLDIKVKSVKCEKNYVRTESDGLDGLFVRVHIKMNSENAQKLKGKYGISPDWKNEYILKIRRARKNDSEKDKLWLDGEIFEVMDISELDVLAKQTDYEDLKLKDNEARKVYFSQFDKIVKMDKVQKERWIEENKDLFSEF